MNGAIPDTKAVPAASIQRRVLESPVFRYLVLSLELAAILFVATRWYRLEGMAFRKLANLIWVGFTVHYFLPRRFRLPFFALFSMAGIVAVFGVERGPWLIGIGLVLLGLAHLPIALTARIALLIGVGAGLAVLRTGRVHSPWSAAIWPVLGSMFGIRMIIYLYDLKHKNAPFSVWRSLSYFFMLPNVCFPLFPVVDYQTFCRTHYDDRDEGKIYQTGIHWMVRGVIQLVLYRLVYQHLPIDATAVTSVGSLLRYLLWPFLLYLQVSGLFHLVVGMLHLFGFNLPETHHLFYLASSFTDFWRRINIYWKDFMMKVFYYPAFFKLRKFGNTKALVLGTFWVFFATWCLHAYQWFWIRGSFLLKWSDTLFWLILSVLVAINVVHESNHPAKRRLGKTAIPWRDSIRTGFKALGVFATISLLWSLWISDSVPDWLALFKVLGRVQPSDLSILPVLAAGAIGFVLISMFYERKENRPFGIWKSAFHSAVGIVLLVFFGSQMFWGLLQPKYALMARGVKSSELNDRDKARRQRDYYEKLKDVGWDNPELMKVYMERPADWGSIRYRPELSRIKDGLPYLELIPNAQARHRGTVVTLNRWGMRDQDYAQEPPADTYRIALLGASHTFGSGVPREDDFESLVEDRLNREGNLGDFKRAEILNFAVEGYSALDVLAECDEKVFDFKPKAAFYVVHPLDANFAVQRLAKLVESGVELPYPYLKDFVARAGIEGKMREEAATRLLVPKEEELLSWAYKEIAGRCRDHGAQPVLVFLPILTEHEYDLDTRSILRVGEEAGFLVIDLSGCYSGVDPKSLHLAPWDDHPNIAGHERVAASLYKGIREHEAALWRNNDIARNQGTGSGVHSEGVAPR